jgi:hypothetical protein
MLAKGAGVTESELGDRDAALDVQRNELLKELTGSRALALYHTERKRFLMFCWRLMTFFNLVSTSSAVVLFIGDYNDTFVKVAGLIAALLFATDLLLSPSMVAAQHAVLARRYVVLEKTIVQALRMLSADASSVSNSLAEVISERLDIQVEEPPVRRWLVVWAQNQIVMAQESGSIHRIPFFQRLFLNWVDLPFFPVTRATVERQFP